MATTAHEVALGVSVDSKAAEDSLKRLSTSLTDLGTTVSDKIISRFEKLNTILSSFGSNASSAASGVSSLNAPLSGLAAALTSLDSSSGGLRSLSSAIRSLSSASGTSATPIADLATSVLGLSRTGTVLNDFSTAIRNFSTSTLGTTRSVGGFVTALNGLSPLAATVNALGTAIGTLSVASSGVRLPLDTLTRNLAAFSAAVSTLNLGPIGAQLSAFGASIASIGAGAAGITSYSRALAQMASAFTRLNTVDANALFAAQAAGVRALSATLTTALGPINNYANALQRIASASSSIATTSSSIGALSAQAAGIQLLSSAITTNIASLTAYAAAMRTLGTALSAISRGTSSLSGLVTGLSGLAPTATRLTPALTAITSALGPFTAELRAAATAVQRLNTRLIDLATTSRSVATAMGLVRSSMGVFGGALGATVAIVTRVIGSLGGLASAFRSTGASARQTSSSVNSSSSIFSTVGSVAGSLTSKIIGLVGAYAGGQAIQAFGEKILRTGANFDNAMGMVKAVSRNASDYSAEAFMAMEREAFRMGRTTTYSATQAAVALKELTQGGLTTQQAVQSLGDTLTLAETEAMDVGDAARIVTSMMAQFQASASELTDFVDKLAKTSAVSKTSIDQLKYALNYVGTAARSANQPFYEVVSAVGALSTAGVESSQAGTTLRDMLTDLTDTTSYSSRKLQALGIDMSKVDPRANKLSEIIGTLKARGIDAADAMAIFGVRGGLAAGSLITVYKQYMDVLNAVQNQSKGTAAIMQQDVTDNLRKDFDKLAASWDYLINRIFKSGLGQMMRGVTQQLKDFTIQIADFVDTLKNAGQFGDLGEIISTSLKIGFGTAINYLTGGLVAGLKGYMEFVLGSLRVLSDVNLWKGLMEVVTALGNGLSAVIKLAIADFIKGNQDFSTSLIQNVMYAGDLFVHKMKEAAGVVRGIASPSYQKARLEAGDADRKLRGAQSGSLAFDLANASNAVRLERKGTPQYDLAMANLTQASDAYNAYVEPFIKAQNDALKKLEQEGERIGLVGDYKGSKEQFAAQARDIVGTAPIDLERSAKEDLAKAKDAIPGAVAAIADIVTKGIAQPLIGAVQGFKPVEVVSQSTLQAQNDRLKTLLKENAPTTPKEPTKTLDKVTQGKQSYGVGEIKMDSKGSTTNKAVVDSMKEMGSGTETSKWQSAANPLQKATDNNTKAVNDLTSAITGAGKETTAQILPTKPRPGAITESERQTDLATWAATGNIPERLKKDMDAVNAQQAQIEAGRQQVDSRNAAIQAQRGLAANISNVTSMFGGRTDLGAPILAALKRGVAPSFDAQGRPVAQSALELGAPVTSLLQTKSLPGQITKQDLFGVVSQIRLGAAIGGSEAGRSVTPQELITPALQKMQTIRPMDFDTKNQLMGLPSLSPSLTDIGSAASTPMIATVEDKYGEQQVATLSEIKSIMSDMNSNIKNNNKADSNKLVISIV